MPKISKVRITGVKYDNFRKGYEDTILDFTRNDEPDHTLMTLVNQGGKGVLMQLLSQITMPDTRWGKESGNRIISMFYDRYRNFVPYTFHVLIEWKLDSSPEKWLITGICVTAVKRNTTDELEENTGLNYFHYTIEHDNSGYFAIEQFPVYNKKENSPASYDYFEDYIDSNSKYIVKYPMSQTKRLNSNYYEYLKSRGIYRPEWEMMKVINRDEGGVRNYFAKATDNKSVIDKMLIGSITQNMRNYNEDASDNLKEMFISNLSITRDLPRLLERENDYKELLLLISPLLDVSELGLNAQTDIRRHVHEGNLILTTLYNMIERAEDEQKGWETKKSEAQKNMAELNFQRDNIEYAQARRNKLEKQKNYEALSFETEKLEERLNEYKARENQIKIDILLKNRSLEIDKRDINIKQKEDLISSLGLKDIQEEIDRLDEEITGKWDNSKVFFEEITDKHIGYQNGLEKKTKELSDKRNMLQNSFVEISIKLGDFSNRLRKHKEKLDELTLVFDAFRLAIPEYLLEEVTGELSKLKDEQSNITDNIEKIEEEIRAIEKKEYETKTQMAQNKKESKDLNERFEKAKHDENAIKLEICEAVGLDATTVEYTHQWSLNQKNTIKELIEQEEERLNELRTQALSVQIDLGINKDEYWIPNSDILMLKESILKSGILGVMTGTEFINSQKNQQSKDDLVYENPLLPYGIILTSEKDWVLVEKNIDKSLFLRSAVPIFIRSDMNELKIKSIYNEGIKLAIDSNSYNSWLKNLVDKETGLDETIKTVKKKVDILSGLYYEIDAFVKQTESSVIWDELLKINDKIERQQKSLDDIEMQLKRFHEQLDASKKEFDRISNDIHKKEEEKAKLASYVEEDNKIKQLKPTMDEKEHQKQELKKEINNTDEKIKKIDSIVMDDLRNFTLWKTDLERKMNSVKTVISDAYINFKTKSQLVYDSAPEYSLTDPDSIFIDLQKRQDLYRDAEQKNVMIRNYDEKINEINLKINELEEGLDKLTDDWRTKKIVSEGIEYLKQALEEVSGEVEDIQKDFSDIQMQIGIEKALLGQLEENISKLRRKIRDFHNKTAEPWDDIDLQRKEYEINDNIISTQKELKSIESFIKSSMDRINKLNISISGLKAYEELDSERGHVDETIMKKLERDSNQIVSAWQNQHKNLKHRVSSIENDMKKELDNFQREIKVRIKEKILYEKLNTEIHNVRANNFQGNLESFSSMKEHFQREMETTSLDKAKAEQVRGQWAQRASKHVIRIIELMKQMVRGMVYVNKSGYTFPLVKLKGDELMPSSEEDVVFLLKEHFVHSINEIIDKKIPIEDIDDKTLDRLMGDQALFSKAVRGRYPVLMVYKMTEKNEFKYAKPHDYYYASWEALNRGEEGSAEGSGGQKLAISTFMMMMLVNYKKRTIGSNNPWTVLLMDNPFGQASAKHILDPIFEIASSLNFQLIAFAPPEIVKIEISKRFPIFWELRIESIESNYSSVVTSRLIHGGRKILTEDYE
jgi:hypothetical protein